MGRVNPWVEEAFRRVEARRRDIRGIPAVIEVEPGKASEVVAQLRRLGYRVVGVVSDFVFADLPEPADFEVVSKIKGVRVVSVQKRLYPLAFGVDEIFKRVAIAVDPLLSKLELSDLYELGVKVRTAAEIPTPLGAVVGMVGEALRIARELSVDPARALARYVRGFPPVIARADWMLVTDTRKLMEVPEDNRLTRTYVGVIDTGVYPNPAIGLPLVNWTCDSLTIEPPTDTMGHGSWVHSCAFGQPSHSRYGRFVPVASAPKSYHVKVFSAFGPCSSFQVMKAMEMCAARGCRVVNMSLGGPLEGSVDEDPECVLARKLYERYGTNFVVAAGNDGEDWSVNSPGASPYVLCVAAVDWKTMDTSSYSSRGPQARWYRENGDAFERDYEKYGDDLLKPDVAGIGGDRRSQIVAAASLWYDGLYDLVPDGFDLMIGTCLPKDTIIYTPNGPVELGYLKPNDVVYSFDGEKLVPAQVQSVLNQGVKEVYEVELSDGRTLIATGNHPVLVQNRESNRYVKPFYYKRVDKLTKNDRVILAGKIPENVVPELKEVINEDIARSLGYFLADGWITRSRRNSQICTAQDGEWVFERLGIPLKPYMKGNWLYAYSKRVALALTLLGLNQPHKSARLPRWVFHLPKSHMIAFMKGFCYGDGAEPPSNSFSGRANADGYRLELASGQLIKDLKILCDYAGVFSGKMSTRTRVLKPPHSKEERGWQTWTLYIRFDREPARMLGVVNVRPIGKEEVYDLTVPPYSNFIANGIIVHNSMATPHVAGLIALAIDRGLVRDVVDVKRRMSLVAEKVADKGYGLLTWSMIV